VLETESGSFRVLVNEGISRYLFSLPSGSIRELYFGGRTDARAREYLCKKARNVHPEIKVFECEYDWSDYSITPKGYMPTSEYLQSWKEDR